MTNELDENLQRFFLNITCFILLFILYASLLPFNITSTPIDVSPSGFLSALQMSSVTAEQGDWIGHVIFNALVTFVACLYCGLRREGRQWIIMLGGIFVFGLIVEYFQMFVGSRGTSLADIYANAAGILIGYFFWLIFGKFTTDAVRYYYQYETLPLNFVRKLYLAFVIAIILFPFDFYITPLQIEVAFATKGLPLFENEGSEGIGAISLLAAAMLTFPLGILYKLSSNANKRRSSRSRRILIKFALLFLVLEVLQFFELSGQSSVLSLVCKYIGFLFGFMFGRFFDLKFLLEFAIKYRILLYVGLPVFIWLALRIKGLTFALPSSMSASMDVIAQTSFLPFVYYIEVGSGEALLSFLLNFVIFLPLGALLALRNIADEDFSPSSFTRILAYGAIIALLFEVLVLIWGLKRPDVTNIFVSSFATGLGYYFVMMCLNSISKQLPEAEIQAS